MNIAQAGLDRLNRKSRKSKSDLTRISNYRRELERLQRLKATYNASIPSAPLKRALSKPIVASTVKNDPESISAFQHAAFNRGPVMQQAQPMASGSNIRLPAHGHDLMDTDEDKSTNEGEDLAAAMLHRIGPVIPALPALHAAEHFDDNGDFHGRGRDLFVGPQAKADEYVVFSMRLYLRSRTCFLQHR